MQNQSTQRGMLLVLRYVACYAVWLVLAALSLWLMLQLRINLIDTVIFFGWGPWVLGALDKFGILLLGVGWLIFVLFAEHYLRTGVEQARLFPRTARMTIWVAGMLTLSYGLQFLMAWL